MTYTLLVEETYPHRASRGRHIGSWSERADAELFRRHMANADHYAVVLGTPTDSGAASAAEPVAAADPA